ncbi:hypothetical protein IH979_01585 [Patescibacteria group bacterium]|nr:hypothetical protein [Patescibacteria group bacterium]
MDLADKAEYWRDQAPGGRLNESASIARALHNAGIGDEAERKRYFRLIGDELKRRTAKRRREERELEHARRQKRREEEEEEAHARRQIAIEEAAEVERLHPKEEDEKEP